MTVRKLIALLREYPADLEIHMEVRGHTGMPTDIDWASGGSGSWLIITDYPVEKKEAYVG